MKVVELFNRIGRRGRGGDFTGFSLNEQGDVATAANEAIQQTYNLLPSYYKEITEGFVLPAPQPLTLAVTQFSDQLSSDVFTTSQIGASVVLNGDPAWNQVIATNRLTRPYMGQTGTVGGTVYGDSWYSLRYPFDRVIGNPRLANQQTAMYWGGDLRRITDNNRLWNWLQTIGQPVSWWTQMLGNSQGNEPLMVIRFTPAPSIAYSLSIKTAYCPKRLTPADYLNSSTIVVPDQFLETVLLPLAYRALMGTPVWESRKDEAMVLAAAERAEMHARNQPGQNATPNNYAFTPTGF